MSESASPTERPPRSGVLWTVARIVLVVLVLAAAFSGGALVTLGVGIFRGFKGVEETTTRRPRDSVVLAVRDLAQLHTVTYHMERVIDIEDEQSYFGGYYKTRDALLLIAAADVTAGVDLGELGDGDVVADPDLRTVTITLPPPQVLATTIDNERTYVYSRETDTLARRREDLESRARQEAEARLREAATEAGILGRAQEGARRTVTQLLRGLGYEKVDVRFRER